MPADTARHAPRGNTFEGLCADLRAWAAGTPAAVAAVELLIWKAGWLLRADFTGSCITRNFADRIAAVDWDKARDFHDRHPTGSTSEMAILDLAITLGQDRFRFASMGHAHRRQVVNAIVTACELR